MQHTVLPRPFSPSVKRVLCDKTKGTCAHILYHMKDIHLVFWQGEWLLGTTPSTWNLAPNWALSKTCQDAGMTPWQYNWRRCRDSRSLKTPGQQRHCTKSDRRPVSNYHITAKPGRCCRVLMYREFVFDLREAAAVWNQGNTDTTEGELVSK